jgi:hypothetical protein
MMNIDEALGRLAAAPVHGGLERLDEAVFARIHALNERDRRAPGRIVVAAAVGAVAMGIAGAGIPAGTASAAGLSPFGVAAPLAPSTLLLGDQ